MKKAKIYSMAMVELLRRFEKEQKQKDGIIKKARLPRLQAEIDELHAMILEAEKNNE